MNKYIAFIGAGSIAEAIIAGLVRSGIIDKSQLTVTNRNNYERLQQLKERYQINIIYDKEELIKHSDIIFLAVKPNDMEQAIQPIKKYLRSEQLIISVTAGVSTTAIQEFAGLTIPIIRAMPNTSASIGYSATALCTGTYAKEEHLKVGEQLFNTIGTTVVVDEAEMHLVTGLSGSGPAYIYYVVEAMEKAAVEAGMDEKTAKQLINQTVLGAGEMLNQSEETAAELRKKITSPAGTTEAGVHILEQNNFQNMVVDCIYAARDRSIELGK
ncbi:pyrroline-5-carboxylate reductase [Virgibacillus proomii]|jgi:pyrroline-5-carboxylate reductase|uniref:pyrroline-5-carboxylate reductase n=1 Tax=Virgibacillus proomii TaxID=84407 RepID=UPI000986A1D4|nr:pyrroline-5-carboxylate reductase [Virgibacillus proomii]